MVRMRLRAARLPFEDSRVIAAMLIASARQPGAPPPAARAPPSERHAGGLGLAPAMVALSDRDLAAYHGVEHKAIGAYEAGSDDPASATKEHERCGSNLVVPMLVLSAAGQVLLERPLERPGPVARGGGRRRRAPRSPPRCSPGATATPRPSAARAFHRPGHEIQRLIATKEPTPEQLEVGVAALGEILRVEQEAEGESRPSDPLPAT